MVILFLAVYSCLESIWLSIWNLMYIWDDFNHQPVSHLLDHSTQSLSSSFPLYFKCLDINLLYFIILLTSTFMNNNCTWTCFNDKNRSHNILPNSITFSLGLPADCENIHSKVQFQLCKVSKASQIIPLFALKASKIISLFTGKILTIESLTNKNAVCLEFKH